MESMVDSHPQRKQIVQMILGGVPVRKIAASVSPPIGFNAIQKYKTRVVRPAAIKDSIATQAITKGIQAIAAVEPYVARMMKHADTADKLIEMAVEAKDVRGGAAIISADVKAQELAMRATGLLDAPGAHQTSITIVCPAGGSGAPEITVEPDAVTIDIGAVK